MDVAHVAQLANLTLKPQDEQHIQDQFTETLNTVAKINELDTSNVKTTSQVTGLLNITRPDVIDLSRVLTPQAALSQTPKTHAGYFVVPYVFEP